jgi:predicted AAA+ superfamily ATPase
MDPSLSASMARGRDEKLGWRLENLVYLELRRRGYQIAWARTKSGYEVDFVARHYDREALLVQVSWDISETSTRVRELRAIEEAADEHDIRRALLITRFARESLTARSCEVEVLPVARWLTSPP